MHERPALLQLQRVLLHALYSAVQLQLTTSSSALGATGAVETAGVMAEPSMFQPKLAIFRASSGGSRWSAAFHSSTDELAAHAAAGWHQSVAVSSVAEVSYVHGRSDHVRRSLLYIPSVRTGVRRMCVLSPGAERGSRQADRALDRDLVYLSLGA